MFNKDATSNLSNPKPPSSDLLHLATIPTIDLEGRVFEDETKRKNTVDGVKDAAEKWGFFQVVNHGVSLDLLERMKDGVRRFNEQAPELKKQYYSRDFRREFVYTSNFDLYTSSAASWRDTFSCYMAPNPPKPQDLPEICRYIASLSFNLMFWLCHLSLSLSIHMVKSVLGMLLLIIKQR